MEHFQRFKPRFPKFTIDSDYFWLVNKVHELFEISVPITTNRYVRLLWLMIKIFSFLQYIYLMIQLFRLISRSSSSVEEFMASFNLCLTLTASLARLFCLAFHRQTMLTLQQYINSKNCQRDDSWAFELRKATYARNVKFFARFQLYAFCNSAFWCFTEFRKVEAFQIPFVLDWMPPTLKHCVEIFNSFVGIVWSFVCFLNFTQFATILNSLRTELAIIVKQFENIFFLSVSKYALDPTEIANLNLQGKDLFWEELDSNLKHAIFHHSKFVKHYQQLRAVSSVNFFILLSSATVMIAANVYLNLIQPSLDRIPLFIVAVQFMLEVVVCCTMFERLEQENDKIARHVYGIDWLHVAGKTTSAAQRRHRKSIWQNALLVQRQVHGGGLKAKAGGMLELNRETSLRLINLVYSMLTFLLKAHGK